MQKRVERSQCRKFFPHPVVHVLTLQASHLVQNAAYHGWGITCLIWEPMAQNIMRNAYPFAYIKGLLEAGTHYTHLNTIGNRTPDRATGTFADMPMDNMLVGVVHPLSEVGFMT